MDKKRRIPLGKILSNSAGIPSVFFVLDLSRQRYPREENICRNVNPASVRFAIAGGRGKPLRINGESYGF